ncbi:MAG: carboxypeptidase regulatory-like domain-containing protein, partial [Planctomycetes bacterium]|nr:carboxypeptidase regulatory-like domain-containing protein [Planctomycetota bacterium]
MNPNRFWTAVLVGLLSMTAARVPAAEPSPPRHLSVSGQVVGPDGKPVAGATVYLRQWTFRSVYAQTVAPSDILATAPSDDQGRFAFREVAWPPLKPIRDPGLEDIFGDLVATARGYGLA